MWSTSHQFSTSHQVEHASLVTPRVTPPLGSPHPTGHLPHGSPLVSKVRSKCGGPGRCYPLSLTFLHAGSTPLVWVRRRARQRRRRRRRRGERDARRGRSSDRRAGERAAIEPRRQSEEQEGQQQQEDVQPKEHGEGDGGGRGGRGVMRQSVSLLPLPTHPKVRSFATVGRARRQYGRWFQLYI